MKGGGLRVSLTQYASMCFIYWVYKIYGPVVIEFLLSVHELFINSNKLNDVFTHGIHEFVDHDDLRAFGRKRDISSPA